MSREALMGNANCNGSRVAFRLIGIGLAVGLLVHQKHLFEQGTVMIGFAGCVQNKSETCEIVDFVAVE